MKANTSCKANAYKKTANNSKPICWLEIGLLLLIVSVLSLQTLSLANPMTNPPSRDGGFFLYVGKSLRSGATLYADIWDSKGPLIFWINALGVGTDFSRWGVFLIELIFWAGSLLISFWVIRRQFGRLPALGTILIGSLLLNLVIGQGNSTEEYSLLFTWVGIAALTMLTANHRKIFWPFFLMGFTIMLNFLLRANNIGTQAVVILVAFLYAFSKRRETKFWHAIIYLLFGALTVAIPTSVYFIINKTFSAMIDASIIYNFAYSTARGNPFSNSLGSALVIFKRWFYVLIVIWILAITQLFIGPKRKEFTPFLFLIVFALPIEALMSSISGRGYGHYFICWIPAYMLLVAFGFSLAQFELFSKKFLRKFETRSYSLILGALLLGLLSIGYSYRSVYDAAKYFAGSVLRPNINREFNDPVSRVVNGLTDESDKVLVFGGQAGINIMSQRDSINGALFYPAINNSDIGLEVQSKYFENLQNEQPLLILDGHSFYPEQIPGIDPLARKNQRFVVSFSENLEQVMEWINENYERYDEANGYIIYRLRSPSQ